MMTHSSAATSGNRITCIPGGQLNVPPDPLIPFIEGEATRLIPEISQEGHFLNALYCQMLENGLLEGVCRACSSKMQVLENIKKEGLPLLDDMAGHPGMAKYIEQGFEIINF